MKIKKIVITVILVLCFLWLVKPFNIVILGSDARPWQEIKGSRSDSIMLVHVTPLLAKIKIVSIPRDSYTEIPCEKSGKVDKITHALAFGGSKCSVKSLENMLNTKIDYSILLRFEDVINITTILGGVEIVSNHSFTQDKQKFVKGETYTVEGERALAYARHRKTDSDFKRGDRQKQVLAGIQKKLLSSEGFSKMPEVFKYCMSKMEIKFNSLRFISMLPAILIHGSSYETFELEGNGKMIKGIYYFIPDEGSLDTIKKEFKVRI